MKYMVASDIHGSSSYCSILLDAYRKEEPDKLLFLGDILYHGPRNPLPDGYDPKKVYELLNPLKNQILCVRGNCDSEVDQMVLEFPINADYCILSTPKKTIYATHGHIYNEDHLLPLGKGDILLHGHTHVSCLIKHSDYTYVNPGSISLPKEDTPRGYMIITDEGMVWKTLDGSVYREVSFSDI